MHPKQFLAGCLCFRLLRSDVCSPLQEGGARIQAPKQRDPLARGSRGEGGHRGGEGLFPRADSRVVLANPEPLGRI